MVGAGVMGAQIAAHLINAKVPVLLFDLPAKEGPKNAIALKAIENLKKLSPAPFGVKDDAQYIQPANYDDDIEKLAECDLVIEAIAERMDWKQDLYAKIAPYVNEQAVLASNTSGLGINKLADALPELSRARIQALLAKMSGDDWQQFANLRAMYALMWGYPGKKLLFMGSELGVPLEWSEGTSLDFDIAGDPLRHGVQSAVRDLNRRYAELPALWQLDHQPTGFRWIDAENAAGNMVSFLRFGERPGDPGGTLVLSEFAGAAVELQGALRTNPYDLVDMVSQLYRALTLGDAERRDRIAETCLGERDHVHIALDHDDPPSLSRRRAGAVEVVELASLVEDRRVVLAVQARERVCRPRDGV